MSRLQSGKINAAWVAFLGSVILLIVLIAAAAWQPKTELSKAPLLVYCAAGIKAPVEVTAKAYEKEYGVPIQLNYGPSQTLLTNAEVSKRGDLFLPADESYLEMAQKKDLIAERVPLARMQAILAVKKGNPKKIKGIADLLGAEVKLSQANPDAAAIGMLVRDALQKAGRWDEVKNHTAVFKGTVNDVAADVKLGAADAAFIWDAMLKQFPDLEEVKVPELDGVVAKMSIAVLKSSTDPTAALRFARYLGAKDKGLNEFQNNGYTPVEGDAWAERAAK